MPSREEIAGWLREASALAKQVSRYQRALGAVRSSDETGSIIRKFHQRATKVEQMRCETCRYYVPEGAMSEGCKLVFIEDQGPDFGCWNWEEKGGGVIMPIKSYKIKQIQQIINKWGNNGCVECIEKDSLLKEMEEALNGLMKRLSLSLNGCESAEFRVASKMLRKYREQIGSDMKLKPCPFCNGNDLREHSDDDPYTWCKNTECAIYDVEVHVDKWNTRATDPLLKEMAEALENCFLMMKLDGWEDQEDSIQLPLYKQAERVLRRYREQIGE